MRTWSAALLATLLTTALAGCLSGDQDPEDAGTGPYGLAPGEEFVVPPPGYDFNNAIEEVHDHSDPNAHEEFYGLRRVGWDPLTSASPIGSPGGGHADISVATAPDGTSWAVVANFGPHRAFSIANVTDPFNPVHVADFTPNEPLGVTQPGAGSYWDVAMSMDASWAVSSAQVVASPTHGAVGGGVYFINLDAKEQPYIESFTSVVDPDALIPVGIHNARPFDHPIEGPMVTATTANGDTYLYKVVGEPGSRTLDHVGNALGTHDAIVQTHPLTGQVILYGAQGGAGFTDITDPSNPELIGFVPNGPELSAYHLMVPSDVLIGGRHYTVSATETTEGTPPFWTLIDTTDPTDPFIVSTWVTPFNTDMYLPGPYRWATHNLDFDHGRIYLGHYHAGVWIIDVSSTTNAYAPVTMAFSQPAERPLGVPRTPTATDAPAIWTAVRHTDGFVYAADANAGLFVLSSTVMPSPLEGAPTFPHNQH